MHKSRDELLTYIADLGIEARTTDHAPVFTVEESKALRGDLPGVHCKNLFLKDKKGQLWLVVAAEDRAVDMKDLKKRIGSAHLSFGRAEALIEVLGVEPGSVTPFAAINDTDRLVKVVLDKALTEAELVNFHPLVNSATTALTPADLVRFLEATGHPPAIADLDGPPPDGV
jgi:Ala-tRNA(Pro) deacylase